MMSDANAGAIETWNGVLFDKWVRFQYVLTTGLAIHGEEALRRYPPREGASVLDIGCGFGDTTRELARRVGLHGVARGFDAAERFVEAARRETDRAGIPNGRFFVADAETGNLGGPTTRRSRASARCSARHR